MSCWPSPRLRTRKRSDLADDAAFIWDQPNTTQRTQSRPKATPEESIEGRITLREAEHRFGVAVSTLRAWSRRGSIDSVRSAGPHGEQWMVLPESVAHHLSRRSPKTTHTAPRRSSGPTDDGTSMLVPRDAWDRLMEQLGNLHEAGTNLAEARERAAKAETEATFLRERLAEMREERNELKNLAQTQPARPPGGRSAPRGWWTRLRDRSRGGSK